ncbi:PaaI family thioesterase [Mycobacterium sp. CVI_P3]|uniref:PaaI family thioesterase n=1 Tax=Mycobacterium pinniadriaticum TaxID=2994102 RepID=A0ABT3SFL4_9MYCO|nr:PaaI family thioesterase [Mycobacterium pinniadriaticum]MCX2931888.1 PaaI family thioesterase [Mycobacterium pinniadriaticum]MCX2938301.1 PaaI family thioesterase [Mycobacterium pinniadriaticum]
MTTPDPSAAGLDPETPESVLTRFGITTLDENFTEFTVVASMPVGHLVNPFTGMPTIGPLAILVDDVAGRANFHRRGSGQWTVSSELTVELSPDGIGSLQSAPHEPVVASSRPLGPHGATLLAICTLSHRGSTIGGGTVRTVAITGGPDGPIQRGPDLLIRTPQTSLADLMATEPLRVESGAYRLAQRPDPMINNLIGIVHGGVSSAGLELVASAAINHEQAEPLRTASIRVNFLRPFFAGAQSRYEGTALRVGRNSAVGDAQAVGDDGKTAIIARTTGYR